MDDPMKAQDTFSEAVREDVKEIDYDIPLGQGRCHRRKRGQLLHPNREPHSVLEEAKREMGSMAYAAQYQQQPVMEDGNLIKWSWFRFYDQPPQRMTNDKIIVSWDTASSEKDLASYSVGSAPSARRNDLCIGRCQRAA